MKTTILSKTSNGEDQALPTSTPEKITKEEVAKIEENTKRLRELKEHVIKMDKQTADDRSVDSS